MRQQSISVRRAVTAALASALFSGSLCAQEAKPAKTPSTPSPAMVQLNFPEEVELKILVDYVSKRLGVKILYDEQIANKKVSIKSPGPIPADSLIGLLESVLKMKGLALVDGDINGWKRIRPVADLSQFAQPRGSKPLEALGTTTAVTQIYELKYVDPERVSQIIKPFLTQPGGNTITV